MADEKPKDAGPFDVMTIKALVGLMSRNDISEIDLRQGEQRIRLVRGSRVAAALPPLPAGPDMTLPPVVPTAQAAPTEKVPAAASKALSEIKSPTPGTFYAAANPDAEPYVKVGSRVKPDTVVCQIEAMKLFTEITADVSGVIEEILVQNQQSVEYGTVLFRVNTGV